MKQYIEVGEIVTTHGIMGEIKVYPWCDTAQFICKFKRLFLDAGGKKQVAVQQCRDHKGMALLKLDGIDTVEQARVLIGKIIYIDRADAKLPKGRYFVQDLIGLSVINDATGEEYGKITEVTSPGRHNVYTVTNGEGKQFLFPAVEEFIEKTDIEAGKVLVKPIEGMFTDAD